jgi:Lrp/AsnC family transcriptional regulator for asnA, asnC and gidA
MSDTNPLDEIDLRLLEILQKNCKTNFTHISNELSIPESTIRYRIERLEKKGIITNYIALVNPRKVGLNITAITMIKLNPPSIQKVSKKLAKFHELRHLFRTTGLYDLVSVVNARDITHLNKLMEEIKMIEGIREVIFEVATELIKVDPTFTIRD